MFHFHVRRPGFTRQSFVHIRQRLNRPTIDIHFKTCRFQAMMEEEFKYQWTYISLTTYNLIFSLLKIQKKLI